MLKTLSTVLVAAGILASSGEASAERRGGVEVRVLLGPTEPPPPIRVERVRPRRGYVWVQGYYGWRHGHYVWRRGHWERARRYYVYVPGRWEERNGVYVWYRGRWHRD